MPLIRLLIVLAVVGLIAWILTAVVPMPGWIATVIIAVAAIGCLIYALKFFGIDNGSGGL